MKSKKAKHLTDETARRAIFDFGICCAGICRLDDDIAQLRLTITADPKRPIAKGIERILYNWHRQSQDASRAFKFLSDGVKEEEAKS